MEKSNKDESETERERERERNKQKFEVGTDELSNCAAKTGRSAWNLMVLKRWMETTKAHNLIPIELDSVGGAPAARSIAFVFRCT